MWHACSCIFYLFPMLIVSLIWMIKSLTWIWIYIHIPFLKLRLSLITFSNKVCHFYFHSCDPCFFLYLSPPWSCDPSLSPLLILTRFLSSIAKIVTKRQLLPHVFLFMSHFNVYVSSGFRSRKNYEMTYKVFRNYVWNMKVIIISFWS